MLRLYFGPGSISAGGRLNALDESESLFEVGLCSRDGCPSNYVSVESLDSVNPDVMMGPSPWRPRYFVVPEKQGVAVDWDESSLRLALEGMEQCSSILSLSDSIDEPNAVVGFYATSTVSCLEWLYDDAGAGKAAVKLFTMELSADRRECLSSLATLCGVSKEAIGFEAWDLSPVPLYQDHVACLLDSMLQTPCSQEVVVATHPAIKLPAAASARDLYMQSSPMMIAPFMHFDCEDSSLGGRVRDRTNLSIFGFHENDKLDLMRSIRGDRACDSECLEGLRLTLGL